MTSLGTGTPAAASTNQAIGGNLFTLIARNKKALQILNLPANKPHMKDKKAPDDGKEIQSFPVDCRRDAKRKGQLLSFGRSPDNDIVLPPDNPDYADHHCFFFLDDQSAGELMLRDLSPQRQTDIHLQGWPAEQAALYRLQHNAKHVQRVIPRSGGAVILFTIGRSDPAQGLVQAVFTLEWRDEYLEKPGNPLAQRSLVQAALGLAKEATKAGVPPVDNVMPASFGAKTVTRHEPIHYYVPLGSGFFGEAAKAVHLETGQVMAVKRPKPKANVDKQKKLESSLEDCCETIEKEAKYGVKLKHLHIVEVFGWEKGGTLGDLRLISRMYDGDLSQLIPPRNLHNQVLGDKCVKPMIYSYDWMERLVEHLLAGLTYLQDQKVVHYDLKIPNIFFMFSPLPDHPRIPNYWPGDGKPTYDFVIGDFGSASEVAAAHDKSVIIRARTADERQYYLPPEVAESVAGNDRWERGTETTDPYILSIFLAQVEGLICPQEFKMSYERWCAKLTALGIKDAQNVYNDGDSDKASDGTSWFTRLEWLANYGYDEKSKDATPVLPRRFKNLLVKDYTKRFTARKCLDGFTAKDYIMTQPGKGKATA
ncbi:kinase-like domain-containing protein [Lasiosphaeria ovina]|uniref:Kinase-like domain-containing protein n=1 Tax=Lasiosphaeria ovina TaxID=92902 RepID=A0AAE0N9V0_9PEZI|nr:kinase-like domain-containing protein [Lasiosphaeria ovina]